MKKTVSFFVFLAGAFIIIVLLALPSFLMRSCKQNASSSENKQEVYTGVTIRDYKKTKNILMGTPASGSAKRVR